MSAAAATSDTDPSKSETSIYSFNSRGSSHSNIQYVHLKICSSPEPRDTSLALFYSVWTVTVALKEQIINGEKNTNLIENENNY